MLRLEAAVAASIFAFALAPTVQAETRVEPNSPSLETTVALHAVPTAVSDDGARRASVAPDRFSAQHAAASAHEPSRSWDSSVRAWGVWIVAVSSIAATYVLNRRRFA